MQNTKATTNMLSSFYSPAVFCSASQVFKLHVHAIIMQQRIDSLKSITTLSINNFVVNDMSLDFALANFNPTMHMSLMRTYFNFCKFTVKSFINTVLLHNHKPVNNKLLYLC